MPVIGAVLAMATRARRHPSITVGQPGGDLGLVAVRYIAGHFRLPGIAGRGEQRGNFVVAGPNNSCFLVPRCARDGSPMYQVARIFFPAVFAAMLLGTVPSGAADDPVATAPIPPPLPAEPLSPATPMMIPATTPPKPKTELPGPAAATPLKKPETAATPKQKTAPQKPEAQAAQKAEPAAGSPRQKPETTARASRPKRPISRQAAAGKPALRKPAAGKANAEEAAVTA